MLKRPPITPPEPVPEFLINRETDDPPNIVTINFYRGSGFLRLLALGTVKIDIHELLGVDPFLVSTLSQEKQERFRRGELGLSEAEIDERLSNKLIRADPELVDDILQGTSPETVEYIRAHAETKLNDALQQLKTEAQKATATKRRRARNLPIRETRKAVASSIISREAKAIERRLKAHDQPLNRRGPEAVWNADKLLPIVENACRWIRDSNENGPTSPRLEYKQVATAIDQSYGKPEKSLTNAETLKKLILKYMRDDWDRLRNEWRMDWALKHRNGN